MTAESEVEEILRRKAEEIARRVREMYVDKVDARSRHGIYVYDPSVSKWRLLRVDGDAFEPGELGPGSYVVYFDNTKCKACRIYDEHWYPFIERHGGDKGFHYVIVLCAWFSGECDSPAAAKSFRKHLVAASPTTLLAHVDESGRLVYREKYEGVLTLEELERIVPGFPERASRAARGEKVEPPVPEKAVKPSLEKLLARLLGLGG